MEDRNEPASAKPAEPNHGPADDVRIARHYAHFHRVLGELLLALSEREQTFWLTADRHRVTPKEADNRYAKAVYVVSDLTPYEDDFAELEEVRGKALARMGSPMASQALLVPKVCRNVDVARILENTGFSSRSRKRSDVLGRLAQWRETALAARSVFAGFASRAEKLREIQRELGEIDAGLRALEAVDAAVLREHYRYPRYMCHVYYGDSDAFDQLYVGDVGVVLQGRRAQVRRHAPKRRKHRRTKGVTPLATVGPYVFYDEEAWREARERA